MQRLERALYVLFAAVLTLAVARAFYGYMLVQTGGEWAAPLDDVFIHFDYARAIARGHPFEWSEGNGFSSGNTSILYPFALAAGYWVGFRETTLMVWAGIVACLSVFAFLLATPKLFSGLPRWARWLVPPAVFAVGALDWSLWSGMEVAFFLGIWAGALATATALGEAPVGAARARLGWLLGLWGALLVLTRPEGATSIAILGVAVAVTFLRSGDRRGALGALVRAGLLPIAVLVLQAVANRVLTGETAANGAIVKLALYNPYMTAGEKLDQYVFLLKYVVMRNADYHFGDARPYGWFVPALALAPLFYRPTRRSALILWASALSWLAIVALNGQVRWQNERYTMPAVAWILVAAALGVAVLLLPLVSSRGKPGRKVALSFALAAPTLALVVLFAKHQAPRMRDQIWFFGRASRNIRDQHVTAGRLLRKLTPPPRRVLVGDAGALMYASDLPGLDLIGLGGFHDLPFARAGVHGLGATLELIERLSDADKPDYFAIYPSWWGDLPIWFGRYVTEVPVVGNVICGGAEKVIYRADWHALGTGARPRTAQPGEQVTDEVDVADLVSEKRHAYEFPHPSAGFVDAKILPDPAAPGSDLFDAGRRIPQGRSEKLDLALRPNVGARLIARSAPEHRGKVLVKVDGEQLGVLELSPTSGWQEVAIEIPPSRARALVHVELSPVEGGDWVDSHVWAVQAR